MAQLVEHCSANAEAMGLNPVEALKTFLGLNLRLLNRNHDCDDHIFISLVNTYLVTSGFKFKIGTLLFHSLLF